jgi:hypothetical protein
MDQCTAGYIRDSSPHWHSATYYLIFLGYIPQGHLMANWNLFRCKNFDISGREGIFSHINIAKRHADVIGRSQYDDIGGHV